MDQPAELPHGAARRPPMLVAGCCLLLLAAAAAGVMRAQLPRPWVTGMDQSWLTLVTSTRNTVLTGVFKVLSVIGGPIGATILVAIICLGLLVARRWRTALYLAIAEASGSACSQLIKHIVLRPRPPHPMVTADLGSFPSGHVITTLGVGLALTVAFARPGHRKYALAAVAAVTALMMYCRTYLAAHWLSDTMEGVLVGAGLGLVLWWIFDPVLTHDRDARLSPGTTAGNRDASHGPSSRSCE